MRDFMLNKYRELCETLLINRYTTVTVYSCLHNKPKSKFVILRHDVDGRPQTALRMAKLEYKLGIVSSYYFRYPYTFEPEIIEQINELGHEVGYHYEILSKAKGDYEKAIKLFEYELNEFRKIVDVKTICMHGSPLSRYDNRDLWNRYNFKEFGIVGEAYLSIKDVNYFSDTGRSWNWKNKMRDFMIVTNNRRGSHSIIVNNTDELMELIKSKKISRLYILAHPETWASNYAECAFGWIKDFVFNVVKKVLMAVRGKI